MLGWKLEANRRGQGTDEEGDHQARFGLCLQVLRDPLEAKSKEPHGREMRAQGEG